MRLLGAIILGILSAPLAAWGQTAPGGGILRDVGFDQNLNSQVPLDTTFRDETGRPVALGDYFGTRPVVLTLVYFRCPLLCSQELNGLARSLKPLALTLGKDYDVVTVSISPDETPELAASKKAAYIERYDLPGANKGWHFLTGDEASIARLARAVGFRYVFNPKTKLYAHAAGVVVLTPEGRIARYFYGIDYPARDLRFGLIEASAGRVGGAMARLLLLCYDYDATTGKYTLAIMTLTRVLGTATALALGTFVFVMLRRDRRRGLATSDPLAPATT